MRRLWCRLLGHSLKISSDVDVKEPCEVIGDQLTYFPLAFVALIGLLIIIPYLILSR